MNPDAIATKVRDFLEGYVLGEHFANDDNLFNLGLINSLMAMQMVMFLEKEFAVKFTNDELNLANFSSVDSITHLLATRQT
jgi:acyl carrier protein